MIRNGLLIGLLVFVTFFSKTQNLIPNGSFEVKSQCPFYAGQIEFADGWYETIDNTSSDYYNGCGTSGYSIPNNYGGHQIAKSGSAYIGIYVFNSSINHLREYISISLEEKFIINSFYRISFYVSLADTSMYGINRIGAFLSDFNPDTSSVQVLDFYQPQVNNPANRFLVNSDGWEEVSAIYKATGGEEYITIGNFFLDSLTEYQLVNTNTNQPHAYYYIDDVSVIKLPDQDVSLDSISFSSTCYSESSFLQLHFSNAGVRALDFTEDTAIFSTEVKVNGAVVQDFDIELNSNNGNPIPNAPLEPNSSMSIKIGPVDLSAYGSFYQISINSFSVRDSNSSNDTLVFEKIPERQEECFELMVPNIFTPNGDGINDFFIIGDAGGKELRTKIYNRWGVEVANFKGNEGWGGAELPAGVYFYVVQEMKNGQVLKIHKGEVTIVR